MSDDAGPKWQLEFPYRWDGDEAVSRRELLKFAVFTSGALCAGTFGVLAFSRLRGPPARPAPRLVARLSELAPGTVRYFTYPGPEDQAMLVRMKSGALVAYQQRCPHLSCAVIYQGDRDRLYCPCHDGVFEVGSGAPTAGPPRRPLARIALRQDGDFVYAVGVTP